MLPTVPPERPVDPLTVAVLAAVDRAATELGIDYFLLGAMARDIVLHHLFAIPPSDRTRDIDIAACVSDWAMFNRLRATLLATNAFRQDPHKPLRPCL